MTMLPAKSGVSAAYPNPNNAVARPAFAQEWDVLNEMNEAAEIDIASAATVNIGGQTSQKLRITGTTTITSFGSSYRGPIFIRMAGALTITNGAALVCPDGASILTVAGDLLVAWPKATGGTTDGWLVTTVGKIAASVIPAGTVMSFFQAAAPVGWTQVTTHDNKAMRVVSGTGGGSGGSVAFTTAFASQAVSGSNSATTLTIAQVPAHVHSGVPILMGDTDRGSGSSNFSLDGGSSDTASTGGGGSHNHTFTGTAINLAVQYINMILASKN